MRIKLFEPFLNYKSAYLTVNKEPRRHIVLVDQDNKQSCTSFARYLMCIKEKRLLDPTEIVDHIDGNSMHDRYENYQILSRVENTLKGNIQNNKLSLHNYYLCGCGKEFSKRVGNCQTEFPSCSKSCSVKVQKGSQSKSVFLKQAPYVPEFFFKLESIEYDESYVESFIKSFEEVVESTDYENLLERFKSGETLEELAKEVSITIRYLRSKFIELGYKFTPVRKTYWPPENPDILKEYQKGDLKLVPGYENYFAAHKEGKVYSLRTGKYLNYVLNKAGYHVFTTREGGRKSKSYTLRVHRLIALTFLENPEDKPFINHIDGVKTNNHLSNLEWCTPLENTRHALETGLMTNDHSKGELNPSAKLTNEEVRQIREEFKIHTFKNKTQFCLYYAELYGIHKTSVLDLLNYKTYKNV